MITLITAGQIDQKPALSFSWKNHRWLFPLLAMI